MSAGASVRVCGGENGGVGRAACSWTGESVRVREGLTSRESRDMFRMAVDGKGKNEGGEKESGNGWRYNNPGEPESRHSKAIGRANESRARPVREPIPA